MNWRHIAAAVLVVVWFCTPIPGCGLLYVPLIARLDPSLSALLQRLPPMNIRTAVVLGLVAALALAIFWPALFFLLCWIVGIAALCVALLFLGVCGFIRVGLWWNQRKGRPALPWSP